MKHDLEFFKKELLKEKKRLEGELSTIAQRGHKNKNDWEAKGDSGDQSIDADPNEVADKIEHYETNQSIVGNLKQELNDVLDALSKIEKGKYGICEILEHEIEDDRLVANPAARTCKAHMK